jgi:Tol biopolymer transport system component|tara:strand:- start:110 stop:1024 length:915 start_codon:yes stop_codon:yes gene_type:complete
MKNLVIIITFLTFNLNSFSQLKLDIGLTQLGKEDICQITRVSHDSWVDWSINDDYIVYISPQSGNNNLYRIKIADLELTKVQSGFYAASYLLDSLAKNPTEQITFETERTVECPVIVPNSNKVAYRSYFCNESYECLDFDLRIYDFKTKESKTIFKEEMYLFDFIDSERLLFVPHNNDSIIKELNIKTGKTSTFKTFDFKVTALQIHSGKLLINSSNGIYSIDLIKKDLEKKYSGKIFATRLTIVDQKLVATLPGPASGIIDLNTNTETKLFNAYDYEPTLSNDNKFVAVISERALGILIKRIK